MPKAGTIGQRLTLHASYAVAADGGGSPTRKMLGINYAGESGAVRDFMGGRMFAIHFRSPELYDVLPHPRAWMYWAVNRERRAFMAAVNGRDEFTFHTQLKPGVRSEDISDAQAKAMFHEAFAAALDIEIIGAIDLERRLYAGRREISARPHPARRRRRAPVHADRRAWLQHRGRGRGQSRLEALGRAQGLGRRQPCSTATRPSGR